MIEIDEFDTGPRCIFSYGHTFGHALEAVTNYKILRYRWYGMDLANYLSVRHGLVNMEFRNRIRLCSSVFGQRLTFI